MLDIEHGPRAKAVRDKGWVCLSHLVRISAHGKCCACMSCEPEPRLSPRMSLQCVGKGSLLLLQKAEVTGSSLPMLVEATVQTVMNALGALLQPEASGLERKEKEEH